MRVDIDKCGVLHIAAETELESFALTQWGELSELPAENGESRVNGSRLIVDLSPAPALMFNKTIHRTEYPMPDGRYKEKAKENNS